ncbi:hypothetical protein [Marinobacter qingdaonensis]|uniref:Uncharacterized protein n=1 Tax=Marinobacter qingdaonensis TaxID=3108486 RepID=A0ABU5P085_9GAMM|nr:hypothetical protein [Marinobacter sp. ASW11-75]MEA1081412.1 hypothetical protein [Marinobacter sp. ASW11-75]
MWIKNNIYFHFLCAAVLTVAAYVLGLSGGFYFDDEWNILGNQSLKQDSLSFKALWDAALSGTAGPLGRPLAMLSFALNYVFFGFDPFYFKLVNLLIHVLCGVTIYAISLSLCEYLCDIPTPRRRLFAFLVMLLWLLHPINLTTVLYSVQRMAGLSALFTLLGMLAYLRARQLVGQERYVARTVLFVTSLLICWPLALASKENAILLPVYLLILEFLFLRFRAAGEQRVSRPLVYSFVGLLLIPGIVVSAYFLVFPDWILNGYARRDFTLGERLLTEARVLFYYIGQILLPINSSLGLFHDDFVVSKSLFSPWTTILSVVTLAALSLGALIYSRKLPVFGFGVLFFLAAHLLESSVFALELVHEHRNYLASFSVLFAVAYVFVRGTQRTDRVRGFAAACLIIFFGVTTTARAAIWGEPVFHVVTEVSNHPQSPRANYGMGKQYATYARTLDASPQKIEALEWASLYFGKSAELRQSYTDGLFGLLMMEGLEGYEMGSGHFNALLFRLGKAPFSNNNFNYLNSLLRCLERGDCTIADAKLEAIISACQENDGFSGKHARQVLVRYERFLK